MAAKLTRLNHKIATQLHLVAETICSSRSWQPVQKLLDTSSYVYIGFSKLVLWICESLVVIGWHLL